MPKLFDVHTHTNFAAYKEDRDSVINNSLNDDIWIVNVGTQKDTSREAVEIAKKHSEGVFATVGLHPIHTDESFHDEEELGTRSLEQGTGIKGFVSRGEGFDYEYYKTLAKDKKVVAIGECGLDYYRITNNELPPKADPPMAERIKQKQVFEKHIELAHELQKPLMIHCRDAFSDLISILNSSARGGSALGGKFKILNSPPGIIHFFSGNIDEAKKLIELGFSFSFGGVITFTRSYDEVLKVIPIDRLLLETDAPYVAPIPYRGKRNEPAYIVEIAKKMAEIKKIKLKELSEKTTHNALNIFGIL